MPEQQLPIGRGIDPPGHFAGPAVLESVRTFGDGFKCRVCLPEGTPDGTILSGYEAGAGFGQQAEALTSVKPAGAGSSRTLVESARIRLAYTHDRNFAVSLSGLRTLPHQIEAIDRVLLLCPAPPSIQRPDSEWARGGACTDG
jgi:hypothetical protein